MRQALLATTLDHATLADFQPSSRDTLNATSGPSPATSPGAFPPYRPHAPHVREADVDDLVRRVLEPGTTSTRGYVAELLGRGVSAEEIYLDLLPPVAQRLGEYWEDDVCDFMDVTVALGRLQHVVREVSRAFSSDGLDDGRESVGRVLLSCPAGEQHTLGLLIVAEFFVRDGWVVNVGPPLADGGLAQLVRDEWFDVVGLSASCDTSLTKLASDIRRVRRGARNREVCVLVGGYVFGERPELVDVVGADGLAPDARSAPSAARQLLAGRRGECKS